MFNKNNFAKAVAVATIGAAVLGLMPLAAFADNPVPSISSISPSSIATGSGSFTLTVNGSNFVPASVIDVNGVARSTTYVSGSQLTTVMTGADTANPTSFNITVFNASPGGGNSNTAVFSVNSTGVVPAISSISPSSINACSAATTVTINGSGFSQGSTINFNGASQNTNFVSSNQLTTTLNSSNFLSPGNFNFSVSNPNGGGVSSGFNYTINSIGSNCNGTSNNPVPFVSSISPNSSNSGSAGMSITVFGSSFVPGAVVNFNGLSRPTTYVSSGQLTATIYASDQAVAGPEAVSVTNPAPAGGTSNAVFFTVNGTGTVSEPSTPGLPNTGFGPDQQDGINRLLTDGALAVLAALTILGSVAVVSRMRKEH